MPNSRRRMFHTCTGMVLFTVCNTLRGSSTVQDRLRRPHNIRPHFSSPSPYVLSAFCQMRLLYEEPRLREVWRRQNMRAASDQAKPRRLPRRLSPEGSTQPSRTEPKLPSLQKEYATSNSFTICNDAFKERICHKLAIQTATKCPTTNVFTVHTIASQMVALN